MKKAGSKSPLKEPLLRLPGQSIDERMHRLFGDKLVSYVLFALVFFLLASLTSIQALSHSQPSPWIMTVMEKRVWDVVEN